MTQNKIDTRTADGILWMIGLFFLIYVGGFSLLFWMKAREERRHPCLELGSWHKVGMIPSHRHCVRRAP